MENTTLVALKPSEMGPAQQGLADWCFDKMKALGKEYTDYRASLVIATRNRWGSRQSLQRAVATTKARIVYYGKIRQAVRQGYVVIPNFDVDVFAVRVGSDKPRYAMASYDSYKVSHAKADLLPAGEGRYVSEDTEVADHSFQVADMKNPGQHKTIGRFVRAGYNEEVDLPLLELKPQVLESIEVALRERIFDRIGIVKHRRRSDPIVVGQIIDPRHNSEINPVCISFFVAWWLDTASL